MWFKYGVKKCVFIWACCGIDSCSCNCSYLCVSSAHCSRAEMFFFFLLSAGVLATKAETAGCVYFSHLDMGWCYTPDTPVLGPGSSDLRSGALGYCRFSSCSECLGYSLCCTETRSSRLTSPRSPCGPRFSPVEAPHLLGAETWEKTCQNSRLLGFSLNVTFTKWKRNKNNVICDTERFFIPGRNGYFYFEESQNSKLSISAANESPGRICA